jgi:hypothetical protein
MKKNLKTHTHTQKKYEEKKIQIVNSTTQIEYPSHKLLGAHNPD